MQGKATVVLLVALSLGGLFVGTGCGSSEKPCTIGSANCACTGGGACDPGLSCVANKCMAAGATGGAGGGGAGTGGAGGMSGGNDGGTDAPVTDPTTACAGVSALCNKLNECAPLVLQLTYGSVDNCIARYKISCIDGLQAPESGTTAATISACAAALPGATCEAVIYNQVEACRFKGKRANGASCGTDAQCMSAHCAISDSCGVCAAPVGAGVACTQEDDCTPGLICSDDGHCVQPGSGGTACNENQPCRYGFYCRSGSCVATASSAGATCQDVTSCEIYKGIFCRTDVQTCAKIGYAGGGESCGWIGTTYVVCSAGVCNKANDTDPTGLCASLAADGAACGAGTTNAKGCQFPARCVGGHCKLPSSAACL